MSPSKWEMEKIGHSCRFKNRDIFSMAPAPVGWGSIVPK